MILQIQKLNFSFSPERQVLRDVSLTLDEQRIYALMGSNGSGKTTLLNIISGFIMPQKGEVLFHNKTILGRSPYKINHLGIGRTFQDIRLITKLSVKDNVLVAMHNNPSENWFKAMFPPMFYRKKLTILDKKADEIIERFFLLDVINSLADEISYGQQKLLTLACCVANGAKLLMIDEAVAGIQPDFRSKIAALIKQLKAEGKTVLFVEHNSDFIAEIADQILFLHNGEISIFEDIEVLRNDKQVMQSYI